MRAAFLAAASSLALTAAQPCSSRLPYNWNNYETQGLAAAPAAATADACAAACCALPACSLWQLCPAGATCGETRGPSCWIGNVSGPFYASALWVGAGAAAPPPPASDRAVTLGASPVPAPIPLNPPVTNPATGDTLSLDSLSLRLNGVPILPVCGEMHPSRVPYQSWRSDLLRMRAGGLTIVNSYVMWLHTTEVQGQPDWSGNRNLTLFLQTAKEVGMLVALRIGPWDHGECRNGGLPDWVLAACKAGGFSPRSNTPGFLNLTRGYFERLAAGMKGYGWGEGGPVISIQVDNETPDVDYLLAIKALAIEVGMKPAFWVKTGWPSPSSPVPYGSLVPLYGGYPDEFWGGIRDVAYGNFLFNSNPNPAPLPPLAGGAAADAQPYPYLTVEVGGGMASSYHRRIHIDSDDVTAQAYVFYGSGVASLGFYMYHGGTDPMGVLSTMQESQLTGYPNDMPTRTYDFHAPLGEAGQPRAHYHGIRALGALSATWGRYLAPMPSYRPARTPSGATDADTLRCAVRSDGASGLVFLNARNIHVNMSYQRALRLNLTLSDGSALVIPSPASAPPDLPAGSWGVWAFNLPLPHAPAVSLVYATAAPLTTLPTAPAPTAVFHLPPGVPTGELAFNATSAATGGALAVTACSGACSVEGGVLYARALAPGLGVALALAEAASGAPVLQVLLLDAGSAARAWTATLAGQPRLLLSDANTSYLLADPASPAALTLRREGGGDGALWLLPAPASLAFRGAPLPSAPEGAFVRYELRLPASPFAAAGALVAGARPARAIPLGPARNAQAPAADGALGEFEGAQVYSVALSGAGAPEDAGAWDVRLRVRYQGDCARLYAGNATDRQSLAMDHFFNGHPMEYPLTRAGGQPSDAFTLRVLPLARNAQPPSADFPWGPVMFEVLPAFNASGVAVGLDGVEAVATYEASLVLG